jgi:hypothetical protein
MTGAIASTWPEVSVPERPVDDDISGRIGRFHHGIKVAGAAYGSHEI